MERRNATKLHVAIDALPDSEGYVREMLSYLQYARRIAGFTIHSESPAPRGGSSTPSKSFDRLVRWKINQQLVRVKAVSLRGEALDMACKILNYDLDDGTVSLYDVDRKQVELLSLGQIEDMRPAQG
ncbi:hypothetical protein FE782_31490 [Paenibacillus antri]|uniref:Uncharacterized protein n=1 Tax=Paenibacillus antri TaxID=2582848 RepID=A0A5R9G295_9BACL|nr:hypothetical protein [Paenibacillus antri]TLS48270.1 hypothetical protein FE782_31490 [Paenibacillus antri]